MTGLVRWYSPSFEFGFIQADGLEHDVFVHQTSLLNAAQLKCGQKVEFVLGMLPGRGPRALAVKLVEGENNGEAKR